MWPYWLMLLVPAWGVLVRGKLPAAQARMVWAATGLLFALMMGLRHEVGGDWTTYDIHFDWAASRTFLGALTERGDPAYYGLNWLVSRIGGDVHALNLACAVLLAWGTVAFCRKQPAPWLALFAAVPYLLVVVGMGYTRQAAAIGCALLALVALGDGRRRAFVIWILLGAAFHKTAVVLLPIAALSATRNRAWTYAWVGAMLVLGTWVFLLDTSEQLWTNYVESDYRFASQGAGIRVAMDAVAAIFFLIFRKRLSALGEERKLWTWLSLVALLCIPLLQLSPTAVDRMALYLIPLQLFVFGRLPRLATSVRMRTKIVLSTMAYYTAVQFVWLNFAQTAFAWLPYQMFPFVD